MRQLGKVKNDLRVCKGRLSLARERGRVRVSSSGMGRYTALPFYERRGGKAWARVWRERCSVRCPQRSNHGDAQTPLRTSSFAKAPADWSDATAQ